MKFLMHRRDWVFMGTFALVIGGIFLLNVYGRETYISTPEKLLEVLGLRFGQPPDWSLWGEGLESPYAFRFLFRFVCVSIARLLELKAFGFWVMFVVLSYMLTVTQSLMLYRYSRVDLQLSKLSSALAISFVIFSFTSLFAYEFPVWVFEDVLAYLFVLGGLMSLSARKSLLFQACVVLGVLTRETLLILVIVDWMYSKGKTVFERLIETIPGFLAFLIPRMLMSEIIYNPLGAGSILNFKHPIEALVFLFATFGMLWFIGAVAWQRDDSLNHTPFRGTISLLTVLIILLTSLVGGRLRETRLMFLAFPWIVVPAAVYIKSLLARQGATVKLLWSTFSVTGVFAVFSMMFVLSAHEIGMGFGKTMMLYMPWLRDFVATASPAMIVHLAISVLLSCIFVLWQILCVDRSEFRIFSGNKR